ncbi:RsmB/NOP family class I SAM-dependent RNA methyltransferase [Acuticoccus sp. I52.16.1]|uniref:RsmB/NOP family class I SAM-dependent RNA methyltransferase n=1 Tax=Acuticoccus sp. I52.16.1 TaxID=2928472 RepID=UPI001FD42A2A|nr:transcription antitermination factor NusB [Acuticoccus sp. I52.16.1]UOM35532.1 MFS transporter [Acuticoccus sp. I52.16.1]
MAQQNTHRRGRARPPKTAGTDPRAIATTIVDAVCEAHAPLAVALEAAAPAAGRLEPRDAALARAIARVTVRRRGDIDWCLGQLMNKKLPRKATEVRSVLRMSAAQLLFMRQADHAAVNTAVALLKATSGGAGFAGLTNAVLRRLIRERDTLLERLPLEANTPAWLWQRWTRAWGEDTAGAIAAIHREEPTLDLAFAGPDVPRPAGAVALPTGGARLPVSDVTAIDGYGEGGWWVQDAAAQLPALALGNVAGKRVLDMCAAPGGKTMQLAAAGAMVTALEIDMARAERLRENLARTRLGERVEVVVADAMDAEGEFDAVLLDAPCSATGTMRRQPDVAFAKTEKDIASLAALQGDLLRRAATCVVPGGTLVYATCSIEPEEGERQAAWAVKAIPELALRPLTEGPAAAFVTPQGIMRTLPSMSIGEERGMDGFFAARFERAG